MEHFNVYALLDISGVGRKEVLAEVAYTARNKSARVMVRFRLSFRVEDDGLSARLLTSIESM